VTAIAASFAVGLAVGMLTGIGFVVLLIKGLGKAG